MKEAMEAVWQRHGIRCINHKTRWGVVANEFGVEYLYGFPGTPVKLKLKRSKYRGATQPWLTPEALDRYRAHRAFIAKHGHGMFSL